MSGSRASILAASFSLAVLMMSFSASAGDVQSAMLSTDTNCPDALISGVAANKIGAPLLITERGALSGETASQLQSLSVSKVYIIGGPAAVSDAVEQELAAGYDVVRLWGVTRYGTSAEVALEFWESAQKVMLVSDALGSPSAGRCGLISEAKDLAMQEGMPVLLIARNSVPDQTVDALANLGTETVVLVGDVGSGVADTLEEMGIVVEERIGGTDENVTRERLREKVKDMIQRAGMPLVIVAVGSWSDTINAPYMPNGTSRHISDESQIDDLIDEIQEGNYTRIKIVGKPALAQLIYDRLAEAGIDATLISGRPAAVAAAVMEHELAWIKARARAARAQIDEMCEKRAAYAEEHFGDEYARVEAFIEGSPLSDERKQSALSWLQARKASFDGALGNGSYCAAWEKYSSVQDRISQLTFEYKEAFVTAYRKLVEKETTLARGMGRLSELADRLRASRAD